MSHAIANRVQLGMLIQLFKEGGFPMFFVLAFGLVALATSFFFAVRPSERHIRFIKGMGAATLFSVLCGFCIDFSVVTHYVAGQEMSGEQRVRILLEGFGESLAPGGMGFPILSLVALCLAVGQRRLDARQD